MIEIMSEEAFERIKLILHEVPGGAEKALKSVISRAVITARKTSLEEITSVYDIKQKNARDRRYTKISTRTKKENSWVVGEVIYSGVKIPLYKFGVKPEQPKRQKKLVSALIDDTFWAMVQPSVPIKVRLLKNGTFKRLDNAFVERFSGRDGAETNIYERQKQYGNSTHLKKLMGSATAQMVGDSRVLDKIEPAIMETVAKRTEHEISRILHGYGGK